jgi:hypothetical protein
MLLKPSWALTAMLINSSVKLAMHYFSDEQKEKPA